MAMNGASEASRPRIAFEPALEGLRGFALLGMLCFHSEFAWAVGGFLPIATFFTLSGYLITALFLAERQRTGRIRLAAFWARRFRRLMPAALLTLGAMSVFAVWVATPDQVERLRAEVLWALGYAVNWHFILSDVAYRNLFAAPSPVQHFWSLAIEEQFYFLFPLIVVAGLRLGSGSRARLGAGLAALAVASVVASVWLTATGSSIDRIYYGTDTRAAELLLGAVCACVLHGRELSSRGVRRAIEWIGVAAMLAMVALWASVELEAAWLYVGGFAAYTFLSVAVIAAGVQPSGPVRALLAARSIRWMGRVSYGAYLFHWPIYLWLTPARTGLEGAALFALRVVVTFGLAGISYEYLEAPIRKRRALTGWRAPVAAPAAFIAVIAATLAVTAGTRPAVQRHDLTEQVRQIEGLRDISRDASDAERKALREFFTALKSNPNEAPSLFREVPRIALFGDSAAVGLGLGLGLSFQEEGKAVTLPGGAELGCGLMREGVYRRAGKEMSRPRHCKDRNESWTKTIELGRPDIAIVLAAPWDVCDRMLPGDDTWRKLGDPVLDAYLRKEMVDAVDLLASDGSLVVWLTHPAIEVRNQGGVPPKTPFPGSDPSRMTRLNELIFELEEARPGKVRVVDLASYMRTLPGGELDPAYRPDGTHLSMEGSLRVATDWLGLEILRVYRDQAARTKRD